MSRKSRPRELLYLTAVVCLWLYEGSGPRLAYAQSAPARAVVEIGDEKITSNDLESFAAGLPAEPAAARASRLQQVQSLIAMRLFARAARAEKLDNDAEFVQAKVRMRAVVLIYAFYRRTVQLKLSEETARKYFDSHKEELQDFTFSRNRIHSLLRDQALNATNEALMQEWEVHRDDEALRTLDLRNIKDPGRVLARIGSTAVTAGDLLQYIGGAALERITEFPAKKLWLDGLILERLYLNAAEKAGLAKDPSVQRSLLWAEDQFLASRYSQRVNAKVTLADARRYYEEHKEEFQSPDQLRLRQILVAEAADAASVQAKLKQGERFEDIAKTFSTDRASAGKEGEIGWVRKGMLHPEVEQVVFQLKPHQISDPIRAPTGYYIVKLEERVVGAERAFDKVASYILMQLKAKAVEAERDRLAKLYKVVIHEGRL